MPWLVRYPGRVATLVARGVRPEELFAAVTEEVGQLLPVSSASMGRLDSDGMVTTVSAWSAGTAAFPVGNRWVPEGKNALTMVVETGRPTVRTLVNMIVTQLELAGAVSARP